MSYPPDPDIDIGDERYAAMSKDERAAWADGVCRDMLYQLELIKEGLAVRAHGLIYFLPLCHDAYGEGNG